MMCVVKRIVSMRRFLLITQKQMSKMMDDKIIHNFTSKSFCLFGHLSTNTMSIRSELPRPILWNQTSDVRRGSTLITRHRRYIT